MVLVLGIVKASLEILGIGIGVKKVVLLRSDADGAAVFAFSLLFSLCPCSYFVMVPINKILQGCKRTITLRASSKAKKVLCDVFLQI